MGADIFLAVVTSDGLYYVNMPKNLLRLSDSCHSGQILDVASVLFSSVQGGWVIFCSHIAYK